MSPRIRSAVLLGVVILMLLAGYFLQKLDNTDASPSVPNSELTPATGGPSASTDATPAGPTRTATPTTATPAASSATRDLSLDEAQGGHTLARHVGRTDQDLAARLKAEPDISAASSYFDRATAERSVGAVLAKKASDIQKWEKATSHANLAFRLDLGAPVGRSLKRGASKAVDVHSVVVVLAWNNGNWFVLTSYPEDR
ncbi:MAG: RNase A-like domain-containing protein [bacterium]